MSEYFFDNGSENANLRLVFQYDAVSKKINKYAEAFKKAEAKIHAKYDKLAKEILREEEFEIQTLVKSFQKKIKIVVPEE